MRQQRFDGHKKTARSGLKVGQKLKSSIKITNLNELTWLLIVNQVRRPTANFGDAFTQ